ncbi:hypothetical protein P3L10_000825 [Capsicum annuum]
MVISALMRDVRDKKVVDLIKAALTTPVITTMPEDVEKKKTKRKYQKKRVLADDEPKPDPYWLESFFGFAPEEAEKVRSWGHCGILSPLLANVCLDELDRWMEGKIQEFYRPSKNDVIWNSPEGGIEQGNTSWPEFVPTSGPDKTRKIDYIRFGGHILIGVRRPRADAATLKKQLIEFCDQKYMLKLDNESLPIEHITKGMGSLAKLYAAKYKLRSRAKAYKIGSRTLSRPLKEKKGQSPEYHNLLRMGLVESIDGLMYTRMSLVPETDYTLFPMAWRPDHEKALLEYIKLSDRKTLEEQQNYLKEQGLVSPQDYISVLVWNYKRNAVPVDQRSLLLGPGKEKDDERNESSDDEEGVHAAEI